MSARGGWLQAWMRWRLKLVRGSLSRPSLRSVASLNLRLRAFGTAPTPDPREAWREFRVLLGQPPPLRLRRIRRRRERIVASIAVAAMLVAGVALASEPMIRLISGTWEAWRGLARVADSDRSTQAPIDGGAQPGHSRGDANQGEQRMLRAPDGHQARHSRDNSGSDQPSATQPVVQVNRAPAATDDTASTKEDTAVTIDVLDNDLDPDNDELILRIDAAAHGKVEVDGNDEISYEPPPDFAGSDSFTYTVSDGQGGSAKAEVRVEIVPVNDAPVAADDQATTYQVVPVVVDVLDNDKDVDGDPLTVELAPGAEGAVVNEDGTVTYTPPPGFTGTAKITYIASDPDGKTAQAQLTIEVRSVGSAESDGSAPEDAGGTAVSGYEGTEDLYWVWP